MRTNADTEGTNGESPEVLPQDYRKRRGGMPTFNVKQVKRPPERPVVYFVATDCGRIKIGTTKFIAQRMDILRGQSPVALTLLATVRGDRATEHEYHARFAAHRLHGEWFTRCPEIETEIARLQEMAA